MWIPGFLRRRVDPDGAALADAVARQLEKEIGGPELQSLWDDVHAFLSVELTVGGVRRDFAGSVDWDSGRPWDGPAYVLVLVTGATRGQPRRWMHSTEARFAASALPSSAPAPARFDVAAVVGRAVSGGRPSA